MSLGSFLLAEQKSPEPSFHCSWKPPRPPLLCRGSGGRDSLGSRPIRAPCLHNETRPSPASVTSVTLLASSNQTRCLLGSCASELRGLFPQDTKEAAGPAARQGTFQRSTQCSAAGSHRRELSGVRGKRMAPGFLQGSRCAHPPDSLGRPASGQRWDRIKASCVFLRNYKDLRF